MKYIARKIFPIFALTLGILLIFSGCTATVDDSNDTTQNNDDSSDDDGTQTGDTGTQTGGTNTGPTGFTLPNLNVPSPLIGSRTTLSNTDYVVFAWNDLGMHCANPEYDSAVLLPPYNVIWAQVVKRGPQPQIVTSGLTVEYKFVNNTYSYGKGEYGQFWDNAEALFGTTLEKDTGLNLSDPTTNNGLSGTMAPEGDHFEAVGIPITPINDDGTWNPYQVAIITVKNSAGQIVAQTDCTIPVSDEIDCGVCHGSDPFNDILMKHDANEGTDHMNSKPVLCASCHGDPALGTSKNPDIPYLSQAMHGFHATASPQPTCINCHPGEVTKCSRSTAHTAADGNCTTCHGDLSQMASSIAGGRIPWAEEPKCSSCHEHEGVADVDTGTTLYRNATGHGDIYCASCHSSPHAMIPTNIMSDSYQALQYQGAEKSIGSCGACHRSSRGDDSFNEYNEAHGGSNPEVYNACFICHTSVSSTTANWPHAFQWSAIMGSGGSIGEHEYDD